jgi:hypothetical protein
MAEAIFPMVEGAPMVDQRLQVCRVHTDIPRRKCWSASRQQIPQWSQRMMSTKNWHWEPQAGPDTLYEKGKKNISKFVCNVYFVTVIFIVIDNSLLCYSARLTA